MYELKADLDRPRISAVLRPADAKRGLIACGPSRDAAPLECLDRSERDRVTPCEPVGIRRSDLAPRRRDASQHRRLAYPGAIMVGRERIRVRLNLGRVRLAPRMQLDRARQDPGPASSPGAVARTCAFRVAASTPT